MMQLSVIQFRTEDAEKKEQVSALSLHRHLLPGSVVMFLGNQPFS